MKVYKKLISALLVSVMLISAFPAVLNVFADETPIDKTYAVPGRDGHMHAGNDVFRAVAANINGRYTRSDCPGK